MFRSLLFLAAASLPALGAIPAEDIAKYRQAASEHLHLKITSVEKRAVEKNGHHSFHYRARATVLKAPRSASGLKRGAEIVIEYSRPDLKKSRVVGAWPFEVKKGLSYHAYLKRPDPEQDTYHPAAHSGSFANLDPANS